MLEGSGTLMWMGTSGGSPVPAPCAIAVFLPANKKTTLHGKSSLCERPFLTRK